jgi:hypothetical protein
MFRFGKNTDPQKQFIVNKGNIKMVSGGDYKIAYDQSLSGHISVAASPDTIKITVDKDVQGASVYLNTASIPSCTVFVGSGILNIPNPSLNSSYKLESGTLDATLEKARIGVVKAKVSAGILSNNTEFLEVGQDAHTHFGHNPFSGFGMESRVELLGEIEGSTTTFEVGSGMLNFHE